MDWKCWGTRQGCKFSIPELAVQYYCDWRPICSLMKMNFTYNSVFQTKTLRAQKIHSKGMSTIQQIQVPLILIIISEETCSNLSPGQ